MPELPVAWMTIWAGFRRTIDAAKNAFFVPPARPLFRRAIVSRSANAKHGTAIAHPL
jgi:hypothetical protein